MSTAPDTLTEKQTAVDCPACGRRAAHKRKESHGKYQIISCEKCGSDFCNPMQAAPPEWYEERETYFHRWEFDEFLRATPCRGGRLLEIGCGAGIFLQLAVKAGYEALGLDFNRFAVEAATRRGLRVYPQTLEQFLAEHRGLFDILTFFHTLEHLSDPNGFLRTVHGALANNGFVALSVPHPQRWSLVLAPREPWDYPPHHMMRFSKEGLRQLLERNGFRVVRMIDEPAKLFATIHSQMTTAWMNRIHFNVSSAFEKPASRIDQGEGCACACDLHTNSRNRSQWFHALVRVKRAVFGFSAAPFSLARFLWALPRARGKFGQSLFVLAQK